MAFQEVEAPTASMQLTLKLEKIKFQQDLVTLEQTTADGIITASNGAPLEGANIDIQALNPTARKSDPCLAAVVKATSDAKGYFSFTHLYAGVQLQIEVTKAGFIGQQRIIVLSSNKQGDPEVNHFRFTLQPAASDTSVLP